MREVESLRFTPEDHGALAPELAVAVQAAVEDGVRHLVVNLDLYPTLAPGDPQALLAALKRVRRIPGQMYLVVGTAGVLEQLSGAGALVRFPVFRSEQEFLDEIMGFEGDSSADH